MTALLGVTLKLPAFATELAFTPVGVWVTVLMLSMPTSAVLLKSIPAAKVL